MFFREGRRGDVYIYLFIVDFYKFLLSLEQTSHKRITFQAFSSFLLLLLLAQQDEGILFYLQNSKTTKNKKNAFKKKVFIRMYLGVVGIKSYLLSHQAGRELELAHSHTPPHYSLRFSFIAFTWRT